MNEECKHDWQFFKSEGYGTPEMHKCKKCEIIRRVDAILLEKIDGSLNKLQKIIGIFNEKSTEQTNKMIKLTGRIVVLTIVMIVGLIIQIILAIPTKTSCIGGSSNKDGSRYIYNCTTNIGLGLLGNYSFYREIVSDIPMNFP